jgi:hypothetical protein
MTNTNVQTVVTFLIENFSKSVTSADLMTLDGVETVMNTFEIMHELVGTKSVTQDAETKYGKNVLVWKLTNGQESAFALWLRYFKASA